MFVFQKYLQIKSTEDNIVRVCSLFYFLFESNEKYRMCDVKNKKVFYKFKALFGIFILKMGTKVLKTAKRCSFQPLIKI